MAPKNTAPTVHALAEHLHADLVGIGEIIITGLNTLEEAGPGEITFIGSARHAKKWGESKAAAALVDHGIEVPDHNPEVRALLFVDNADLAMAELLGLFVNDPPRPQPGISSQAVVDESAVIDPSATIMEFASVGPNTTIGTRTIIERNVHIAGDCTIGEDCHFRCGVVIRERCKIGARVSIQPNAVIGADGFGYRPDGKGGLIKIPHIGTVILGDDVEIGAGTCVDRGKFGPTVIGPQTKLDNLVQIGHNVRIGRGCVFAAMAGVAGSTVIGDFCQFGGKSGIADHLNIGSQVKLAANSAIMRDVPDGATLAGLPAIDFNEFWRILRIWNKLPELHKTVRRLTREINNIKSAESDTALHDYGTID